MDNGSEEYAAISADESNVIEKFKDMLFIWKCTGQERPLEHIVDRLRTVVSDISFLFDTWNIVEPLDVPEEHLQSITLFCKRCGENVEIFNNDADLSISFHRDSCRIDNLPNDVVCTLQENPEIRKGEDFIPAEVEVQQPSSSIDVLSNDQPSGNKLIKASCDKQQSSKFDKSPNLYPDISNNHPSSVQVSTKKKTTRRCGPNVDEPKPTGRLTKDADLLPDAASSSSSTKSADFFNDGIRTVDREMYYCIPCKCYFNYLKIHLSAVDHKQKLMFENFKLSSPNDGACWQTYDVSRIEEDARFILYRMNKCSECIFCDSMQLTSAEQIQEHVKSPMHLQNRIKRELKSEGSLPPRKNKKSEKTLMSAEEGQQLACNSISQISQTKKPNKKLQVRNDAKDQSGQKLSLLQDPYVEQIGSSQVYKCSLCKCEINSSQNCLQHLMGFAHNNNLKNKNENK